MNADAKRWHVPELKHSGTSSAITFHFRVADPKKHMGWALCTVNETTGELSVCSDWGNWSHRWHAGSLPMSSYSFGQREGLLEFLGERPPQIFKGRDGVSRDYSMDYVAEKLCVEGRSRGRDDSHAFDPWETCKKFKRMLCEARLEYGRAGFYNRERYDEPLSALLARVLWDELSGDLAATTDATLFCERFMHLDGWNWITNEPWEHTVYEPTTSFLVLRDAILPALRDAAWAVVKARRPTPPPLGWAGDFALIEIARERERIADIGPCPICEVGQPVSRKREPVYRTVGNTRCWATRWVTRWTCSHWIMHRVPGDGT